jgi:2-oxoisovalerate dehydrogenase E1 component
MSNSKKPTVFEAAPEPVISERLLAKALLIREFEQRLLKLFAEGKLFGTVHTCIGQEWSGIAVAEALEPGDVVFSNHRCHGHYLARTDDVEQLMAEVMGRQTGVCAGRGGSQHICHHNVYSNGVQGGIVPIAGGMALAQTFLDTGKIVVVFVGDGTLGEGALYEGLNLTSLWNVPLLIVLENNLYAQSTAQGQNLSGSITARAAAFGIHAETADTWHPEKLLKKVRDAASYVRSGCRPCFLQVDTYRLMAHSKSDDNRDPEEVKGYWKKDPLAVYVRENPEEAERLLRDACQRVDSAVATADAAPFTEASCARPAASQHHWLPTLIVGQERMVQRIYAALRHAMERNPRVVVIGEDIEGPYGGAFKVTKDLNELFPGRVRNTPISEAAIVGFGNGLAIAGMQPVCEIMFGDFLLLAADQFVNHAAKFRYMYNEQVRMPIVIRTPMGGKRGYGPTHSQCLEKHLLGVPDTRVLALHHRYDPAAIYQELFAAADLPTLVIENKTLYGQRVSADAPQGFSWWHTDESFPTSYLRAASDSPDLTILCYGGMLSDVESAVNQLFEKHDCIAEVVCPTQLYPFELKPLIDALDRTRKLLVVEEGQGFSAFGSEVLAQLLESAHGPGLQAKRVAAAAHAIPSSKPAEMSALPGTSHIIQAALELVGDE